jgi:DNA-binding MarR family transcriptional regulator
MLTMFSQGALPSTVDELLQRLRRVTRQREFAHGLLPAQWDALRYLARANTMSRTPGALATFLGTTRGTTSQTLTALEGKGCIRRVRNEGDRRVVRLELTEAGHALLAQDPQELIRRAVDDLPQEMSGMMARGLKAVVERLDRKVVQSFGLCRSCRYCSEERMGTAQHRCRLTGEAIAAGDTGLICVSHTAARPPS